MEKKKNSQVQALDDDMLENVAGGKWHGEKRSFCRDCGRQFNYVPMHCDKCGGFDIKVVD